jgi:5-deoxy-glucuronate isomerase
MITEISSDDKQNRFKGTALSLRNPPGSKWKWKHDERCCLLAISSKILNSLPTIRGTMNTSAPKSPQASVIAEEIDCSLGAILEECPMNVTENGQQGMIFRNTHAQLGRRVAVDPSNSRTQHLAYGRIILNSTHPSESFAAADRETGLICLSGEATVVAGGETIQLERFDAIYIPRDTQITVTTKSAVDFAEFSADVAHHYPLQVVRYADIVKDPGLHFTTGGPGYKRQLNMLLAKNVQAGRLVAGFTDSEPGNWTSWPPHEHAKMLEEIYVYFNMPDPAFGIQLVYNNTDYPELVTVVRDGDAVLMPSGFHPNVAVPGHRISFLWAMAAHREVEDRQFGVVNVQHGFEQVGSGLEAGKAK